MDSLISPWNLSAQEAAFMSGALKSPSETKTKIDEVLFAWAANVLSDEQNAFVEETMSKDPSNIPRIGMGKLLFALKEPSAAIDTLEIMLDADDLRLLKQQLEIELEFLAVVMARDKEIISESFTADGIPDHDEVLQEELLNSESRFGSKARIGEQLLRTVNLRLQD